MVPRDANMTRKVELLKAVAHPVRLCIIARLCEGPQHVTALATELDLKQAIVSQQLKVLRMHDLVTAERENGFAVYRLAEKRLKKLITCIEACCPSG